MQVERREAMALARRGMPVIVKGGGGPAREVRSAKDMPPEPGDNYDGPELEYHASRDPDGNWTRAGLEHVLRTGGSVMHHGQVIERLEDLPADEDLAATNVQRLDARGARIAGEIARLSTELAHVQSQREDAGDGAKRSWKDFSAKARAEERRREQAAEQLAQSGEAGTAGHGQAAGATGQTPPTGETKTTAGETKTTGDETPPAGHHAGHAGGKAKTPGPHKKD